MTTILRTFIGTLVLIAYITLGTFMLIGMTDHHAMAGCPFMPGEQAICQMDAFDHISAWQSMLLAVVPTVLLLSLFAAVVFLTVRHWHPPPDPIPILSSYQRRTEVTIVPLYQELFSRGILNPKIP